MELQVKSDMGCPIVFLRHDNGFKDAFLVEARTDRKSLAWFEKAPPIRKWGTTLRMEEKAFDLAATLPFSKDSRLQDLDIIAEAIGRAGKEVGQFPEKMVRHLAG
jgi:hypothetical protein